MSKIRVPDKDHKCQESRRVARDEQPGPGTHCKAGLEHSLPESLANSVSPRVTSQASRVYVALVQSVVNIVAYSYGYTRLRPLNRQIARRLASGSKILAITLQSCRSRLHATQRCSFAGVRHSLLPYAPSLEAFGLTRPPSHRCALPKRSCQNGTTTPIAARGASCANNSKASAARIETEATHGEHRRRERR